MKKERESKKKYGIIYLIVLLLVVILAILYLQSTAAQYRTEGEGSATAIVAKWAVQFSGDNSTWGNTYTMTLTPVTNPYVRKDRIAPKTTATGTGYIQLVGTETAVEFTVEVGTLPAGFATADFTLTGVTASNGGGAITMTETSAGSGKFSSGVIGLPSATTAMTAAENVTFVITATWENDVDEGVTDTAIGKIGATITIPVTVTVTQKQTT